ncbi:MAG: GxxExxY protein [Marinifilaceae bacterium]|jgi:GxxExxY protein|nr:GxxExxY protein [Marinifilaceae bacterium]
MNNIDKLIREIIGLCYKVHNELGAGFLESVYEKSLLIELRKNKFKYAAQKKLNVFYNGENVGDFIADIIIENCLVIELKAVENLSIAHEKQLVNYLVATGIDDGLLINFGPSVVVKRKFRKYRPSRRD